MTDPEVDNTLPDELEEDEEELNPDGTPKKPKKDNPARGGTLPGQERRPTVPPGQERRGEGAPTNRPTEPGKSGQAGQGGQGGSQGGQRPDQSGEQTPPPTPTQLPS